MTVTTVPFYPLTLDELLPSKSVAFSPNLHAWMKKYGRFVTSGSVSSTPYTVWRVTQGKASDMPAKGTLMIGWVDPDFGDFFGSKLMNVLCEGAKATSWCYSGVGRHVEVITDFWENYLMIGRCAIDPGHDIHFQHERWNGSGNQRTCRWCGLTQTRHVFTEMIQHERVIWR